MELDQRARDAYRLLMSVMAVAGLAACGDANDPPKLAQVGDQQVTVGETMRLPITATDANGDRLRFSVSGLPDGAEIAAVGRDTALLVWSPLITDTAPGGLRYDAAIEASDGQGVTSRLTLGIIVFPSFGTPSFSVPAGAVINLANQSSFSLPIVVKDDDSTDVTISMRESPNGARLVPDGRKSAWFSWEPSAAQREIGVHRAIFVADDGATRVEHVLSLILLNAEQQAGCEGSPPTIAHDPPGDRFNSNKISFAVQATDSQSKVQSVVVQWTRQDVSLSSGNITHGAFPLTRPASDGEAWVGELDVGSLTSSGALVHYYIVATDNDDTTGFACDLAARYPKTGYFSAAVYPNGASPSACVNDGAEPDDTTASAPTLGSTLATGRRLCPSDVDVIRLATTAGDQVQINIRWGAAQGALAARLMDGNGTTVAAGASATPGVMNIALEDAADAPLYLDLKPSLPGIRLSYTADIRVGVAPCNDDGAEPDSSVATAKTLSADTSVQQAICPGDADYFRFEVAEGSTYRLSLAFEHRAGDLDLELLGPDGQTVLARAASERSLEEIEQFASAGGTWYARVSGVGAASNGYFLSLSAGSENSCGRDTMSPNQSVATAKALFQDIYENLTVCAGAADWYRVDLNGDEDLAILTLTNTGGPIAIDVFSDPLASPIATATQDGEGFVEFQQTLTRGRYYYRVSVSGGDANYDLLQEIEDPPGPCQPDRFDANEPAAIGSGIQTRLRLCQANDVDVFQFDLAPFTNFSALTSHSQNDGTNLRLRGPGGGEVAAGGAYGDGTYLETTVEAGGVYTLEIKAASGTAPVSYDLAVFWN